MSQFLNVIETLDIIVMTHSAKTNGLNSVAAKLGSLHWVLKCNAMPLASTSSKSSKHPLGKMINEVVFAGITFLL